MQYASLDTTVNEGWHDYNDAEKTNVKHIIYLYESVNHDSHKNTTLKYHKKATTLWWSRTINFFQGEIDKEIVVFLIVKSPVIGLIYIKLKKNKWQFGSRYALIPYYSKISHF